jgi:hypothetical protein
MKKPIYAAAIILACALGLVLTMSACAGNLPPVSQVADSATKVEQSADQILKAAQAVHAVVNPLTGKPTISTAQLDQVAIVVDKVGREGQTLAKSLNDYSILKAAGSDTTALSTAIQALIGDITAALGTVGTIVPSGTVQQIDQAVASTLGFILQIKTSLAL